MRELKFRVWDKLVQRFIYPDGGYQGHYVLSLNGEFTNLQNGAGGDDFVVQQWTGLTDKNGKDIYEGDIIKNMPTPKSYRSDGENYSFQGKSVKQNRYMDIIFEDGGYLIKYFRKDEEGDWDSTWLYDLRDYHEEVVVVGNIFENKGLLNG